jgi:nicotinamidase-related amidase
VRLPDQVQAQVDPWGGTRGCPQWTIPAWTGPVVRVRHHRPGSPFAPGRPGYEFKPEVADLTPALEVEKQIHSAFHGAPDLHAWLSAAGVDEMVICGIQTNRCCETTARVAADLGYRMRFVLDATYTFDKADADGATWTADQLSAATAARLHGYFGTVVRTDDLLR